MLIKSKSLNVVASGKGGASQRGRLLPRDRRSPADEAGRRRGGAQGTAGAVLSVRPLFGVCGASLFLISLAAGIRREGRFVLTHYRIIRTCPEMGQSSVRLQGFLNSGR